VEARSWLGGGGVGIAVKKSDGSLEPSGEASEVWGCRYQRRPPHLGHGANPAAVRVGGAGEPGGAGLMQSHVHCQPSSEA
jgi:hypothetical protein